MAVLLQRLQKAGYATILLDTEGEYTRSNEPTSQTSRVELLSKRGLSPEGVDNTIVYHLVGRETANPDHPKSREFAPRFSELSPHAVSEILELTDAQRQRFMQAYDAVKLVMADIGIFTRRNNQEDERRRLDLDELETGYPDITLGYVMDMVGAALAKLASTMDDWRP